MKTQAPNEGWLKYVCHKDVFAHMAQGWMVADDFEGVPHHGRYSVIMWHCGCAERPIDPPPHP